MWLCHADELLATQVIHDLNALNVRHVISDVIIRELLTSRDRTEFDEALVRRVHLFNLPPYRTRDGLIWEVLLLSGQERVDTANLLRSIHDELTSATSWAIMARRETSAEQTAELLEASRPLLKQIGFPEDIGKDLSQTLAAARTILATLGVRDLDWPEEPTPESFSNLSEQINHLLGPVLGAQLEEKYRIQDSSTKTEDRSYKVAIGSATDKEKRLLGNTLRDTEHIMMFVNHSSEVDLLQVDSANENIIKRSKPVHRLAELGLSDRCFSADSLTAVVDKVNKLKPS